MTERPTDDTPDWLTISEAAEFLGVSVDTVRRRTDAGDIPCWRPTSNSHRRFARADLLAFRSQTVARSA